MLFDLRATNGTGFGTVYREQGLAFLEPGTYTAQIKGLNGATGIALIELYEMP